MPNPSTEDLKVQLMNDKFVLSWENPVWVLQGARVSFPMRPVSNGAYVTLSLKDNEFLQYLQEVDGFMTEWIIKYNERYNTEYTYQCLVKDPMTYDDDGNLVINMEALERYGYHFDARIMTNKSRARMVMEKQDGAEITGPDMLEVEGSVHQGAIVSVAITPSLYLHETSLRIIPKITRMLIVESDYGLTKTLLKAVKPKSQVPEDIEL